jgi:cytidine deaminase
MEETLDILRARARTAAEQAHTPYSARGDAAALLLADGAWVPGVRVESASFSLVIPPLVNAFTTAVAAGRTDVVAVALNRPFLPEEIAYVRSTPPGSFRQAAAGVFVAAGAEALPAVGNRLDPFLAAPAPEDPAAGIALARQVARRAYAPESHFPVGCVLVVAGNRLIPGVNVEHADWSRILCAERNALGTALSWGVTDLKTLYLTCPKDLTGSPCGACRQLLAELAPAAAVWMDRGDTPPETASPGQLLPDAFHGQALVRPM